ncbi:unnamed protein product [Moneuplotes crassus]|uniref:Palmitoyltransferase n=1 Tax=Euplotes crassus TaxID=5936 RepID=A0AAD1TZ42_EUPCR|nr:unnamed protein product [Moneuplotes crassus]
MDPTKKEEGFGDSAEVEQNSDPEEETKGEEDEGEQEEEFEGEREEQETGNDIYNETVELDNAHDGADMDAADGYAQVNDTQTEEEGYNMGDEVMHKISNEIEPQSQHLKKNTTPKKENALRQPAQNFDPNNVINVVQSCIEGQFKPLLACIQRGFINKDVVIDPQIGRRAIHLIAHFGNIKAMRVINEVCEADMTAKDFQGLNVFHYASGSGEIETLKYLYENCDESSLEEADTAGMTPLMHAASKNSVICFIYLYFHCKANIRVLDKKGCNILHWAAYSGSLPIIKILHQEGLLQEFINKEDTLKQTPIMKSFYNKNIEIMKFLIGQNCDLYTRDYKGNDPEEFIQRYLDDKIFYNEFLKCKYKQKLESCVDFSEVRNNFERNRTFMKQVASFYYQKYSNFLPQLLYTILLLCMLFTHWHYTSVSGERSTFYTAMRNLAFYIFIPICVSLFMWLIKTEPMVVPKKQFGEEGSIINDILKSIDDTDHQRSGDFPKIVPLSEVCFDTNIRKIKHGEYCPESDSYVIEYQKFCDFIRQPIGQGNANFYFLWLTSNLILIALYNYCLVNTYWHKSPVILYFRPFDCILRLASQSLFYFTFFFGIQIANVIVFQNWIWIVHATGRRQTINETKNSHKYRYIYKRVLDKETKNYLYIHRNHGCLFNQLGYIYQFCFNRLRDYETQPENINDEQHRFSNISMASMATEEENPFE